METLLAVGTGALKGRILVQENDSTTLPLAGVRVAEFSDGRSVAAVCGRLLADLGASVVKFERPSGDSIHSLGPLSPDGGSLLGQSLLADKMSVRVPDHLQPTELLASAVDADIVLLDECWLRAFAGTEQGSPEAWQLQPTTVVVACTPYGIGSNLDNRRGGELILQAAGGVPGITGLPDGPPTRVGVPISTDLTAVIATSAICAALYRSRATGHGAVIDSAEFDTMVMMQGNFLPGYLTSGRIPQRVGNVQLLSAPWNSYRTTDGQVVIVAISESLWARLLKVIERPDLADRADLVGKVNRVANRAEVDTAIEAWTSTRAASEVAQALTAAGVPAGEVVPIDALVQRPDLARSPFRFQDAPWTGGVPGPLEASASGDPLRPFAGLRVLEIGGHTAGGMATRLLADLGADVLKVEMPQGDNARTTAPLLADGNAYLWHFWNVGKQSVVLDLSDPAGHAVLEKLVEQSDVLLENMALDTVEKLGITYAEMHAVNPRLVYCAVSGFGGTGERRYQRAFDAVIQAEAGIMSVTGEAGAAPVKAGPSVVDNATALAAVAGMAAGLVRRQQSGSGVFVDMSLFDMGAWLTSELWPLATTGTRPVPGGNRHPYFPLYNGLVCSDGDYVAIAARTEDETAAAVELFGLAGGPDTWDTAVAEWAATRSVAQVVSECSAAGIPVAPFNDLKAVVEHETTAARDMLLPLAVTPDENCLVVGSPYKFIGEPPMLADVRAVPMLGADTDAVLSDLLGLSSTELDSLRARGITVPRSHHAPLSTNGRT